MKDVTVEFCSECKNRFCREHIQWDPVTHAWMCDKCLRDNHGLRKVAAAKLEATA